MPLVDMPLAELRQYQGRNPKPADFDAFWDRSLAELDGHDPQVQLEPVDFRQPVADCYHLWFTGMGGSRVHAKLLVPKAASATARPALLHFHGYGYRSEDWANYLSWVGAGFVVAGLDCRGQAGLSHDTVATNGHTQSGHIIRGLDDIPERMYYRNVFLDTALLARIIGARADVDRNRMATSGGSQGGALALVCAALAPFIRKTAPRHPFLSDYRRVWEMDLDVHAYDELRKYFRHFDPRHEREDQIFTKLGYIDIQHLMPRVRAEVLLGSSLMDTITPPSTFYAAFNKITSPKRDIVYPDFGHEGLPGFDDLAFTFISDLASE